MRMAMARRFDCRPPPFLFCSFLLLVVPLVPAVRGFAAAPWKPRSTLARISQWGWTRLPPNIISPENALNYRCPTRIHETHCLRASQDVDPAKDDAPMAFEQNIEQNSSGSTSEKKALSPLAMAAADWLEEEEDEISKYWEKFDDAKRGDRDKFDVGRASSDARDAARTSSGVTTEELLGNYHESRGINKAAERKHQSEIEAAVHEARSAASADEAVRMLEKVRPYLQHNTKLGGATLLELAECYEAKGEPDRADEIYGALKSNPQTDIRRRVKQIMLNPASRPKRRFQKGLWDIFHWERWD